MAFTRDMVQGFLDGYIYAGGDPSAMDGAVSEWMMNHPTYKAQATVELPQVSQDIGSYRVSARAILAPSQVVAVL